MPLQVYATSAGPRSRTVELPAGEKLLDVLGDQEWVVAVQLEELFSAVTESVTGSLTEESTLTIEVTGSVDLKAKAGAKLLFFNLGGEAGKATTMKVVLETKVRPR